MQKKNTKKVEEFLKSAEGDWPCVCGHPRRSHLGESGDLCLACYTGNQHGSWHHDFKLDNLTYIEKLYHRKEIEKFKKLEEFKNEP